MELRRLTVIVCAVSVPSLVSCDRSRAEVARHTATIRISAGVATGTFGPFSKALAKGYAELAPSLRLESIDTPGGRATRDGARLVHVNGPAIDKLRSAYPFLRSAVIPAGAYPNQRELIQTLSIDIVLLARKALDDGLVRRLTAGLFQMLPRLSSELDFLQGMDPEQAPATPIPLHRGATLYYRERELRR